MYCVHVLCTCIVHMYCVHVLCTCIVYMYCVHVLCTCIVYMYCVPVLCMCMYIIISTCLDDCYEEGLVHKFCFYLLSRIL